MVWSRMLFEKGNSIIRLKSARRALNAIVALRLRHEAGQGLKPGCEQRSVFLLLQLACLCKN